MKKYFLIMNPRSRGGKSLKKFDLIFSLLNESNIAYDYKIIDDISEGYEFSLLANKNEYDVIVAVGGDGTIRTVMNGFYDDDGHLISSSAMGVIYTGTSPDFCKSNNIPLNTEDAVSTLIQNYRQQIAVGRITFCKENNIKSDKMSIESFENRKTEYFGCCANIGIGSMVARKANSGIRKYLGDFGGTLISLISSILVYHPSDQLIAINGDQYSISKLYNLSVGRTKYIASGIKVHSKLNPDSKQFYCMVARDLTFFAIPGILKKAYSGKKLDYSARFYLQYIDQVEIMGNSGNPHIELDGDHAGYLPCKIEIATDFLTLVVKKV